jgi:hypothetical protein
MIDSVPRLLMCGAVEYPPQPEKLYCYQNYRFSASIVAVFSFNVI